MEVPRYCAGMMFVILMAYGIIAEQVAPIKMIPGIIRYGYPACFIMIVAIGASTKSTTNPDTCLRLQAEQENPRIQGCGDSISAAGQ